MYQIIDHDTGVLITETLNITWLKQQERVDIPILAHNFNEADGVAVIINGEEKTFGIKKARDPDAPNMDNYTPLVKVVEVSGEPYIMNELNNLMINGQSQSNLNAETQNLLLDTMSGVAEMYELLAETQSLQLDTMSGIADMYELAMTKEGGN